MTCTTHKLHCIESKMNQVHQQKLHKQGSIPGKSTNFSLYYQIQGNSGTHPVSNVADTGCKAAIVTTQLHPLIRSRISRITSTSLTWCHGWLFGKERSNPSHNTAFTYTYNSKMYVSGNSTVLRKNWHEETCFPTSYFKNSTTSGLLPVDIYNDQIFIAPVVMMYRLTQQDFTNN